MAKRFRSLTISELIIYPFSGNLEGVGSITAATLFGDTQTEYFDILLQRILSDVDQFRAHYDYLKGLYIKMLQSLSKYLEKNWEFQAINKPSNRAHGVYTGQGHYPDIWMKNNDKIEVVNSSTYERGRSKSKMYSELNDGFKLTLRPEQYQPA